MKHSPLKIEEIAKSIQLFLDKTTYNKGNYIRSAMQVEKEKKANCLEGALYAAWKLEQMNITPFFLDFRAENDDDHLVCLYKVNRYWGAIAKSSTTLLQGRPPVFSSVRELAMSYYPFYFSRNGLLSLRSYAGPSKISILKNWDWRMSKKNLYAISDDFNRVKEKKISITNMNKNLLKVSRRLIQACYLSQ